jgi:hypothetical protein
MFSAFLILHMMLATAPAQRSDEIIIDCASPCACHAAPKTKWDRPACGEYDFDTALKESLERGDHSALTLLQARYETTFTLGERHRIAGMLLERAPDDSTYWRELSQLAEDAVRFTGDDEKLAAFCADHDLDKSDYRVVIYNALEIAGTDTRSHALLLRALETRDGGIVYVAINGLAAQHDLKSLDAIDVALSRLGDEALYTAMALVAFDSDSADQIAMKYIAEEDRGPYLEARREQHRER